MSDFSEFESRVRAIETRDATRASSELAFRMQALETRIASVGVQAVDPRVAGDNTHCTTNICTNCKVDEGINIILPTIDRPMSGREIASALKRLAELEG